MKNNPVKQEELQKA